MHDHWVADVNSCPLRSGECALWWLGQHGFVVKLGATVLYIDPYLTDHSERLVKPLLTPEQVTHADLILGTHDHDDHIDREAWPTLAVTSPRALFVVPELLREKLGADLKIPLNRFLGLDAGESKEMCGLRITGIAAAHEFIDADPLTGRHPYLGYVIEGNGCTLYHAGDTCRYEGLETTLKNWHFDVAMLPINGRDAKRLAANCMGNMTYQEAADLAGTLESRLTIPAHYDMFADNSETPARFADYMRIKYPHLKVCVCEHGKRVTTRAMPCGSAVSGEL